MRTLYEEGGGRSDSHLAAQVLVLVLTGMRHCKICLELGFLSFRVSENARLCVRRPFIIQLLNIFPCNAFIQTWPHRS